MAIFQRQQTLIVDGDAVSVAAQIFQHVGRPAEGWLGVHHPFSTFREG
jgi:hypothetical protein